MTTKTVRHFLWSCLILLQLAFFSGCATSPNIPFAGRPYPSTLEELDQKKFEDYLDTSGLPNIDLLIRTGGDHRLSNYLLWQSAYAELFFTDTLWPDFTSTELESIISDFKTIERRFGGVK